MKLVRSRSVFQLKRCIWITLDDAALSRESIDLGFFELAAFFSASCTRSMPCWKMTTNALSEYM